MFDNKRKCILPAKEVMRLVGEEKQIYVYVPVNELAFIRDAVILPHSGFVRFFIYGKTVGKNTMSAHPDTEIEVYFDDSATEVS